MIRVWGILFLVGPGAIFVTIDVTRSYRDLNSRTKQIRADYIAHQKETIKQETTRVVDLIRNEKAQSESLTRRKIKSRIYEAYSIAQNIYQQNQATESKTKIQQMILDALRPIRFENESGYYFATRMDGIEVLFADKPEMEGLNLLDLKDTHGNNVIKDMIEIVKQSGEGFYEYYWTKPASAGKDFKKISYIKRFEPFDFFIGVGLYVVDVESGIKEDLLSTISRIRFGKEGYIFVNNLNGDALVSNGKIFSGTKKLWEIFNDDPEKMKDIFEKEYNAALTPEGDYIYYSWIKLTNSDKESPKTSFVYGMPDLQWLVGAGVYLDDIESDVALMQGELDNNIKTKIVQYILIVVGICGLFLVFFDLLNRRLKKDINLFISFFDGAAHSDQEIDRNKIRLVELDQMAEYANKMLAERKQSEAALLEREEKYRNLFNNAEVGIFRSRLDGSEVLEINNKFLDIVGMTLEETLGKPSLNLWADPKEREEMVKMLNADGSVSNFEYKMLNKRRRDVRNCLTSLRLYREQGLLEGSILDITDRKLAEEINAKLEVRLQHAQKMESIGSLAGGIAHDLNNILFPITGLSEMLLDDIPPDNHAHENVEQIFRSAKRGSDLVKQILAFSRQSNPQKLPILIQSVLKEALKLARASIPMSVQITSNIKPDCGMVFADPSQVHQIVMNLITNAYHAVEGSGGTINLELKETEFEKDESSFHVMRSGKYACIIISDNGTGIDQSLIDKIFEPYFTTKELGKGTGLGLSVVHGIVRQHGGDIGVYSEVGKGTVFHVYLPLLEDARDSGTCRVIGKHPTGSESILLVDDEEPIAKMVQMMLEKLGYQVATRTSSPDALAAFKSNPSKFDLVISDWGMPNMTGEQLARELISIRPEIPVIICTGFSDENDEHRAREMGVKGFLKKPVARGDLAEMVRRVLDATKGSTSE